MGRLVNGKWQNVWYDTSKSEGKFIREESQFQHWITADGSSGFKAESARYHLYVSLACPWAHRTLIFRHLKGLQDIISLSTVNPYMGEQGWTFAKGPGVIADSQNHTEYLHQLYTLANKTYSGRVTVPVLWDKLNNTIVNNESSEIIRMFNNEFDAIGAKKGDYYPTSLRESIDQMNDFVYTNINNGVYKSGFATTQAIYEETVKKLFSALEKLEKHLSTQRYLVGKQITEADWRLFTTLIRFDVVYVGHFKTNIKRLVDYPHLYNYTKELYQIAGVAETVNFDHIKKHYYTSHPTINPNGIIPIGPEIDFNQPHDRDNIREKA